MKKGRLLEKEALTDTIYRSGNIKRWYTQHFVPLDKRYILMIGGNDAYQKDKSLKYPMAILDTRDENLIEVIHDIDKVSTFINPGYQLIAYHTIQDQYGDFWMATSSHGLIKFQLPPNWRNSEKVNLNVEHINLVEEERAHKDANTHITDLTSDNLGNLWVSSHVKGVYQIDNSLKSVKKLSYPEWVDPNKFVGEILEWGNSLWVDKDDKIWISQYPNHIGWFKDSLDQFEKINSNDIQFNKSFRGVLCEDSKDNLWSFS